MRARLLAPAAYLVLALLGHLPALAALDRTTTCSCGDAPQTDWFLAWTPHALLRGQSPFTTDVAVWPDGVNLMWNTLLPLPGLLMAPVTLTAGPFAAHTLLAVLAFAGSATSMWWVAGRFAPWPPARFAAGLLYGFSPYLVGQGTGHLNLSLVLLPPVVLLLVHELLVRQQRSAVRTGAVLGVVAAAQLLITEEVLASTFVTCVVGLLVLVAQHRRALSRERVEHAVVGLAAAAGTLFALVAWPLAVQFAGRRTVPGAVQDATPYGADLLGPVVPTVNQMLGTDRTLLWAVNPSENGSYLGVPLVVALVVLAVRLRRLAVVRFLAVLAAVAFVLSLGERLRVAGDDTGVPLPFRLVASLPVLHNMAAVRLSLYVVLCAALLVAVALDHLHRTGALGRHRALAVAVAVACVVPLVPDWPYRHEVADTPAYFRTAAVERIPLGAVVLTYPVPRFPASAPMAWQAVSGFRYRTLGGYLITPRPDGSGTFRGGTTEVERVFSAATRGVPLSGPTPRRAAVLRAELALLGVQAVVVADHVRGVGEVRRYVSAVLGRGPDDSVGGVTAWYAPAGPATSGRRRTVVG